MVPCMLGDGVGDRREIENCWCSVDEEQMLNVVSHVASRRSFSQRAVSIVRVVL